MIWIMGRGAVDIIAWCRDYEIFVDDSGWWVG